jgi:hypothetical protein
MTPNLGVMPKIENFHAHIYFDPEEIEAAQTALLYTMVESWRPDITLESMEKIIAFRPIHSIAEISPRPLCIIMNTGYEALHPRDQVMEAYAAASEPKTLVLLPYDQLGFYAEPGATDALRSALGFFEEHLPVGEQRGGAIPRSKFDLPG